MVGGQTGSQLSREARTSQNLKKKKKKMDRALRICTKREEFGVGGIKKRLGGLDGLQ